ncbi:MAG: Ig-like domain-containing protein [bacterium]
MKSFLTSSPSLKRTILLILAAVVLFHAGGCGSRGIGDDQADSTAIAALNPAISTSSPRAGDRDFLSTSAIVLTFNKAIDSTTTTDTTVTVSTSAGPIAGAITYDSSTRRLSFTPATSLSYSTTYTISLTTAVRDMEGVHLPAALSWSFRTIPQPVAAISAGLYHTCAKLKSGRLKCWGRNIYGVLGQGDTNYRGDDGSEMGNNLSSIALGTGQSAKTPLAGGNFTCTVLANNTLKCWGRNDFGQLGLDDKVSRGDQSGEMGDNLPAVNPGSGRTMQSAAIAENHVCAILDNGQLKCWGYNNFGNLGLEENPLPGNVNHGDGEDVNGNPAVEMGDTLPVVNLGSGRTATTLSAGENHTCAILDSGSVKCWGRNDFGQLGIGISTTENRGDNTGEMGDNLPVVSLGTGLTATRISSGLKHVCALLSSGKIKCWGRNDFGQLGLEESALRGTDNSFMGDNLPAVNLGTGATPVAISAGGHHSCALLSSGRVKCWGRNDYGQLGLGHTNTLGDSGGEMGDNLPTVDLGSGRTATALSLGYYHSCALLDNSTVKCWGYNQYGQLGLEDTLNRGDEANEMGDTLYSVDLGSE